MDIYDFKQKTGVSSQVIEKLDIYAKMLEEWNGKINLVGASTLPQLWNRHFLDSAQIYPLLPEQYVDIGDMGSGAGFPGMVLALMGARNMHLIERDARKCAFLTAVKSSLGLDVTILNQAIGNLQRRFDVLTSRALADLGSLLNLSDPIRKPSTICLFAKGKSLDQECAEAQKEWIFRAEKNPSLTEEGAAILKVWEIRRKP